jgi:hypothetical protein
MALEGISRGRQLLLAVLRITTATDVAARCRVTQQSVSDWSAGIKSPGHSSRLLLEANYRIPYAAWDMRLVPFSRDIVHSRKLT